MGPLNGVRIIEIAHIGPVPHAGMLFADMGAEVLRIERAGPTDLGLRRPIRFDVHLRGQQAIALDLKLAAHVELLLQLVEGADALIEGFRPGVAERLGWGPDVARARNPRLVYGRVTGWGRDGPLADAAGHDLNYLALTGALAAIGRAGAPPTPPLNLVADYAGGSMFLAWGVLCALFESKGSGTGQVVDASMIDGVASLMTNFQAARQAGLMNAPRGYNLLDSGAFYYDVYMCADGRYISVACIEERFFDELLAKLGLHKQDFGDRAASGWESGRQLLANRFLQKTRAEWERVFERGNACVAPVLDIEEAPHHAHHASRGTFIELEGVVQAAPSPRFSRSMPGVPAAPQRTTPETVDAILRSWLPEQRAIAAMNILAPMEPSEPVAVARNT